MRALPAAILLASFAASANVNPFVAPAKHVCDLIAKLEAAVTAATKDKAIAAAERKSLDGLAAQAENAAHLLVAAQSDPASRALAAFRTKLTHGQVGPNGPAVVAELARARNALWAQATKDLHAKPLDHLRGWAAPNGATRVLAQPGQGRWAVAVDLANPHVHLVTNKLSHRGGTFTSVTVAGSASAAGAQHAINGDFFTRSPATYKPSGFTMSFGQVWPGTDPTHWEPSIAWAGQHAVILDSHGKPPAWAKNVVSARPQVLKNGAVVTSYPEADKAARSRRTGVGISKDGRVLYLMAETNASAQDIGKILKSYGAWDAFTMDAGGSAQMVQQKRVVMPSSDPGGVRRVANTLMIKVQ